MDRREFLVKIPGLLALPLIIESFACEDKMNGSGDGEETSTTSETFSITSTTNSGHNHSIYIRYADVNNPQANDKTITSSSNNYHTHTITLTTADYTALKNGDTIVKTSSSDGGHAHQFTIVLPSDSTMMN
ncbi:MAG: hypothetical protein ACE5D2_00010 [Fidelibacterota bacterium]